MTPPLPVKFKVEPTHGVLLTITGVGIGRTVTVDTAEFVQPAALVTITVYPPDIAAVALAMVGF